MFNNLLSFWKGKDFLGKVLDEFKDMLTDTESMFRAVTDKLVRGEDPGGLKGKVYDLDEKVNQIERDIRKRIVEHLTLQPSVDVSACLVLMSVVKDAERLGDYCKNLFEVSQFLEKPIAKDTYEGLFDNLDAEILELFKQTREAFIESNEAQATLAWTKETKIVKSCDAIVKQLATCSLSVNEAVCYTLMARYYKRLAAHLTNIATSVILPISDLDYFDEKRKS